MTVSTTSPARVHTQRRHFGLRPLALALFMAGVASPASALPYLWVGNTTGNWGDAANWSPVSGPPGAGDTATINGGSAVVTVSDTRNVGSLFLNTGSLGGSGVLNAGSASFGSVNSATLGLAASTENTLNVSGSSTFAGGTVTSLSNGQLLNLNGSTTWTTGNGRIDVYPGFGGNSSTNPFRVSALNIGLGATFTDAGAAAAAGTKQFGYQGGQVNNAGTYVRNGFGTTLAAGGFNNTGTVQINAGTFGLTGGSQSSGAINVASGAVLYLSAANISAGSINNSGLVQWGNGGISDVGAATSINGVWESVGGSAELRIVGTHSISSLNMGYGYLGGKGVLNTVTASFGSLGSPGLGRSDSTENTLNVSGATTFAGGSVTSLSNGQIVNLNGNTTWGVGNGRIDVYPGYGGNSSTDPFRVSALNIGSGTTFTDAGAAAAAGTKQIGYQGGQVNNAGTYVRNGAGTTLAVGGFNNTGTVQINGGTFGLTSGSQSSGAINVANGTALYLSAANISGGSITNSGVAQWANGGVTDIAAAATINGAWESVGGSAELRIVGTHSISSLNMGYGYLGGKGVLNTVTASFGSLGSPGLGRSDSTENTLNVSGATTFAGGSVTSLSNGQIVNLNGNTTWGVGNGRIDVYPGYGGNSNTDPFRVSALNIGSGTTFTDAGAAAATGTKQLGYQGGQVNNAGTYVRNGLGTTLATTFTNTGLVQVNGGTLSLASNFVNNGTVVVNAGAEVFAPETSNLRNAGTLAGTGTLRTRDLSYALSNTGTIDPGSIGTGPVGTFTITGDLSMAAGSTLHIDLDDAGTGDILAISSDALWGGTLSVWAPSDRVFAPGETIVIATYSSRLSNSTFAAFNWQGAGANPFSVQYNAGNLTLQVTSVPEPGTWAMWLAGAAVLLGVSRRTRQAQQG